MINNIKYLAIIDTETAGFSSTKNALCEIAMLIVNENLEIVSEFQYYIKPYNLKRKDGENYSYKQEAFDVNGLSIPFLNLHGNELRKVIKEFDIEMKKYNIKTVIGHNVQFDISFLNHYLKMIPNANLIKDSICTKKLALKKIKLKSYSLSSLCDYYGIINQKEHSGISDCIATLKLFKNL